METQKSLKECCKEAKQRLKSGFWEKYKQGLEDELSRAEKEGISANCIKDYYSQKVSDSIRNNNTDEETFYKRVKDLLDSEGEVSDAIGRLTDKEYFGTLSYEEKQRYTLSLSERYIKAVERYRREKNLGINV